MSVHATEALYSWYKNAHWINRTKKRNACCCSSINKSCFTVVRDWKKLILRQLKLFRFLSLNVYCKSAKCIHIWCVAILSVSFSNSVFWCHLKMARGAFWRLAKEKKATTKNPNKPALISKTSLAMKSQESAWVSYCKPFKKMGIHGLQ